MLTLIVLTLATWRIASLLAIEDGPDQIFAKLRHWAGVRYDEHSQPYGETELAKGLLCLWCNSVWVGTLFTFLHLLAPGVAFVLAFPLALSAGAIMWERLSGGKQ